MTLEPGRRWCGRVLFKTSGGYWRSRGECRNGRGGCRDGVIDACGDQRGGCSGGVVKVDAALDGDYGTTYRHAGV